MLCRGPVSARSHAASSVPRVQRPSKCAFCHALQAAPCQRRRTQLDPQPRPQRPRSPVGHFSQQAALSTLRRWHQGRRCCARCRPLSLLFGRIEVPYSRTQGRGCVKPSRPHCPLRMTSARACTSPEGLHEATIGIVLDRLTSQCDFQMVRLPCAGNGAGLQGQRADIGTIWLSGPPAAAYYY